MTKTQETLCPWGCTSDDDCEHFLGWTEDGRKISFRPRYKNDVESDQIGPEDRVVKTGVTARIYRPIP